MICRTTDICCTGMPPIEADVADRLAMIVSTLIFDSNQTINDWCHFHRDPIRARMSVYCPIILFINSPNMEPAGLLFNLVSRALSQSQGKAPWARAWTVILYNRRILRLYSDVEKMHGRFSAKRFGCFEKRDGSHYAHYDLPYAARICYFKIHRLSNCGKN